ncbi:UNVERIFIED_CONTAM: hypothetical protein Slati_3149200 [Sesamum latifolium]|uniref:Uncharacterized protein n=1 Tax=Sesamum latifolium TaxID=2727402 RepID=A0AAW2UX93_9LAMI
MNFLSSLMHKHNVPSIESHKYLRNVNSQCYEPDIVAIGPYHSNKDNFKMMEEHKLRYLQLLLERKKENVERYILAMGELEHEARNCYADSIHLNSAKFIKMLVLDGCFIIELREIIGQLINSSKDVDILCECEIIDNWLGDNEVVANIFNRLTLSVTTHQYFVYTDIFDKVNAHYGTRRNKAIATLRRDYFNSPWAYFSVFAALAILLLTVAQTVFSALQVF